MRTFQEFILAISTFDTKYDSWYNETFYCAKKLKWIKLMVFLKILSICFLSRLKISLKIQNLRYYSYTIIFKYSVGSNIWRKFQFHGNWNQNTRVPVRVYSVEHNLYSFMDKTRVYIIRNWSVFIRQFKRKYTFGQYVRSHTSISHPMVNAG